MGEQKTKKDTASGRSAARSRAAEINAAGEIGRARFRTTKMFELDHTVLSKHLYEITRSVNHGKRGITGRLAGILDRFGADEVSVYRLMEERDELDHVLTVRKKFSRITTTTKDTSIGNGLRKRAMEEHCILLVRPPKVYVGNLKPGSFLSREEPLGKSETRIERIIVPLYFTGTDGDFAAKSDKKNLGVLVIRGNTAVREGSQSRDEDIGTVMSLAASMSSIVSEALYYGIDPLIDVGTKNEMLTWMNSLESNFSLIMVELDQFRKINNENGSLNADEIIRCFVEVIRGCTRIKRKGKEGEGDLIARYTGGKIAVVLPNTNIEKALKISERIRQAVETGVKEKHFKMLNGEDAEITCSIGLFERKDAILGSRIPVGMQMTDGAETALNKAKDLGKGKRSVIVCKRKEREIDVIGKLYAYENGKLVKPAEFQQ